jgi:hypothetical protein
LPIELSAFSVKKLNDQVLIKWSTASEKDNDYFAVEKSYDLIHYQEVDRVDGAGNSNGIKNYSSTDIPEQNKMIYYRIKQIDYDGKTTYSQSLYVTSAASTELLSIYPNPAKNDLFIKTSNVDNDVSIYISNIYGQHLITKNFDNNQEQAYYLNITDLTKGIYVLNIESQAGISSQKFVVE